MDGHVVEYGGDGCDGLTELLLDEVFDDGLRGERRLTGGCRQEAGLCIRFGERRGIFEVDAIEFYGVGPLLDLSVNGSNVFPHHTEEDELERRDEKYTDQHGRKTKAERRPEEKLKNEVDESNEE
jgi:hypothetical protein